MKDLRCMVGVHDYRGLVGRDAGKARVEGTFRVECGRCHRSKAIPMRGPGHRAGSPRESFNSAGSWDGMY